MAVMLGSQVTLDYLCVVNLTGHRVLIFYIKKPYLLKETVSLILPGVGNLLAPALDLLAYK